MKLSKILKFMLAVTAAAAVFHFAPAFAAEKKPAAPPPTKTDKPAADKAAAARTIQLAVTENGFEPSPVKLKKDEPVLLKVTRKTDNTCATDFVMKDYGIKQELPLDKEVEIRFTPTKSGTLKYGCAMGQMVSGQFLVE